MDAGGQNRRPGTPALQVRDGELSDDEVLDVWERTTAGVKDGSLQTFDDKELFIADALRRLGR